MHQTFALETYAGRAFNYLDRMVDSDHLPYFNIFWQDPAEAAHDWPDFGDVMTRQLQGAIMSRRMTGRESINEKIWLQKALSYISPETGLLTRPKTSFCEPGADPGDFALTLYALVTAYQDNNSPELADVIRKMTDGYPHVRHFDPLILAFSIKSLMAVVRVLDHKPALEYAKECVENVLKHPAFLQPDNTYPVNGHMHIMTRAVVGISDYALYVHDAALLERMNGAYQFIRSLDPGFGFIPESVNRQGDVILCETCALMDYIGLGVTLANNGHPEYWAGIERLVRNHLVESQIVDTSWLPNAPESEDTPQFSHRDVGSRMVGAYAGWSSPIHILAAKENLHWGGPELRGKVRAFQNCCGGSGTHAYYIAWKNAARFTDGVLSVNMHIDKLLPEAEIRCLQPYQGLTAINMKTACGLRVRVPDFCKEGEITAAVNGEAVTPAISGCFLTLDGLKAVDRVEIAYPLLMKTEDVTVGNKRAGAAPAGEKEQFNQYRYHVTWKGDTVIRVLPAEEMPRLGFSDFEKVQVELFYGEEGPGRLYQREYILDDVTPGPAALHMNASPVDHWWLK